MYSILATDHDSFSELPFLLQREAGRSINLPTYQDLAAQFDDKFRVVDHTSLDKRPSVRPSTNYL